MNYNCHLPSGAIYWIYLNLVYLYLFPRFLRNALRTDQRTNRPTHRPTQRRTHGWTESLLWSCFSRLKIPMVTTYRCQQSPHNTSDKDSALWRVWRKGHKRSLAKFRIRSNSPRKSFSLCERDMCWRKRVVILVLRWFSFITASRHLSGSFPLSNVIQTTQGSTKSTEDKKQ